MTEREHMDDKGRMFRMTKAECLGWQGWDVWVDKEKTKQQRENRIDKKENDKTTKKVLIIWIKNFKIISTDPSTLNNPKSRSGWHL